MLIVEIEGLYYTYAGSSQPVLENVYLKVEEGEFIILTGPSNCGKTTLCRCMNGLIPHHYVGGKKMGRVHIAGVDVDDSTVGELATMIGYVFQNPENQLFALSVERNVAFALENLAMPREEIMQRVEWAMETTGISHLRSRAPYELSGGQQQRVAIASVLAVQPRTMILDEPTSFLDPQAAATVMETISELNKRLKTTIFLVEHRLDLASPYATRIIVMKSGAIMLDGEPRRVFSNPDAAKMGIGIPRVVQLHKELSRRGVALERIPITTDEAAEMLRERI